MRTLLLLLLALLSEVAGGGLSESLLSLMFLNNGVWKNTSRTKVIMQEGLYLEPENVTKSEWAWAGVGETPQVYSQRVDDWMPQPIQNNTDRLGYDLSQFSSQSVDECDDSCRREVKCRAWVYTRQARVTFGCEKGTACCYLKYAAPANGTSPAVGMASRVTRMSFGAEAAHPAVGIRSAPPLGGLATGSVELRGDGTLTAWTVENNNPAGSAKLPTQKKAFLAARIQQGGGGRTWSRVLQTQPEGELTGYGVSQLNFSGSPPVTRLRVADVDQPDDVDISVFGFGRLAAGNMSKSHHPAIAFSVVFTNRGKETVTVASLFNLPTYNENTHRRGSVLSQFSSPSEVGCLRNCTANDGCGSWTYHQRVCTLIKEMAFYEFRDGVNSGTPVTVDRDGSDCIRIDKRGTAPMSGGYALCAAGGRVSFGAGSTDSFKTFASDGYLNNNIASVDDSISISLNETIAAGETTSLTVVVGYYFPNHNYLGQVLGNYYSKYFTSAADSARRLLDEVEEVVDDAKAIQKPLLGSTLPRWMADTLLGQLHHMRSAMWFHDGRWRQWEAYDCVNIDSVHNDGERHIPYVMLFPDSTKSKIIGWGKAQLPNGMIQEQLACGCMFGIDPKFEHGCGRIMSDVSSMYVVYLLEVLRWTNDIDFVKEWFPVAKKAADWQISVSTFHSLPFRLQTTYDILQLDQYDTCSYSAVFHILAMRAMSELCRFMGDSEGVTTYTTAEKAAQESFEELMWNPSRDSYMAFYGGNDTIMADSFYPQVLSYSVGLGALVNETRLRLHLASEQRANFDGVGLRILTGREGNTDRDIWMMANGDHGALLLRNAKTTSDVTTALEQTEPPFRNIRSNLNDVWNAAGILRGNYGEFPGGNYFTSHYGYYMTLWHTMLAVSKQVVNLPEGSVTFDPVYATSEPFQLPVFIPSVVGLLQNDGDQWRLCLTAGTLTNVTISVKGVTAPVQSLTAPDCISAKWN